MGGLCREIGELMGEDFIFSGSILGTHQIHVSWGDPHSLEAWSWVL